MSAPAKTVIERSIIEVSSIKYIQTELQKYIDYSKIEIQVEYNEDDKIFATSKQRIENMEFNKEYPLHITFLKSKLKQKVSRFSVIPQIVPLGFFK